MKWATYQLANDHTVYHENAGKFIVTTEDGETEICGVVCDEKHAPLIAAAPDLLEACRETLEWLEELERATDISDPLRRIRERFHAPRKAVLRAAIGKAEGRS